MCKHPRKAGNKAENTGGKVVKCLGADTTTQEEEEEAHGRKPQR